MGNNMKECDLILFRIIDLLDVGELVGDGNSNILEKENHNHSFS